MMVTYEVNKVRENYLRRQASRLDLQLKKSRARRWDYNNQGGFMITDLYTNMVVFGSCCELNIEDVSELLNEYEDGLKLG